MESFNNDWCKPVEGEISYHYVSGGSHKNDAADIFNGKTRIIINNTHFGDDDFEDKFTITSPEFFHQAIIFKFSKGSMIIDKYSIECVSTSLTSFELEATDDTRSGIWDSLDRRTKKLKTDKRYVFDIPKTQKRYSAFRLRMLTPNTRGKWFMCLHYFNVHGDYTV